MMNPSNDRNATPADPSAGVVIFSGSLYALALTGTKALGAVAPVGGLLLMAGWVTLAINK